MTLLEHRVDSSRLTALVMLSRANRAEARSLRQRAQAAIARSRRLCRPHIRGASDTTEQLVSGNGHPDPGVPSPNRRSVLVLTRDPVMRAFVADAIKAEHDTADAADVAQALDVLARGARIDVICLVSGDARGAGACATVARELYERCPWVPVVVIAATAPPALKAEFLLTGVRAFLPDDFSPRELAATVARVARRPDAAVPTTVRVSAVKETFAVLEGAITDVPALSTLAAMAAMSRSHFSRTFHAVAGISLRDYVRDLRLKRAQELMRASGMSLTAIAAEAGFYDLPHFNKAFRHRFGMSPTQFRLASMSSHPSSVT